MSDTPTQQCEHDMMIFILKRGIMYDLKYPLKDGQMTITKTFDRYECITEKCEYIEFRKVINPS